MLNNTGPTPPTSLSFQFNTFPFPPTHRPGAYDHDVARTRHVEFDESFGSRRSLKNTVTVKCTKGVPEEVSARVSDELLDVYKELVHYRPPVLF